LRGVSIFVGISRCFNDLVVPLVIIVSFFCLSVRLEVKPLRRGILAGDGLLGRALLFLLITRPGKDIAHGQAGQLSGGARGGRPESV
jgi:hypothetical protein